MSRTYFLMQNIILHAVIINTLITGGVTCPAVSPASSESKPFTAECNYMSELGCKRYKHYLKHGTWPRLREFSGFPENSDPDSRTILWELRGMVEHNPLAREYVVSWSVHRLLMDWEDYHTVQMIYRRSDRKLYYFAHDTLQSHATRTLDDFLLIDLLKKWEDMRSQEPDHDKAAKQWFAWWEAQK